MANKNNYKGFLAGEKNFAAKLTAADVENIRKLYSAGGLTHQKLADMYGLKHKSAVGQLLRNKTWVVHG